VADNDDDGGTQRGALIGFAVVVGILAVSLWVAYELYASSKMQDCLMSGRSNCAPIERPAR
jgi:hypothetical protein